ncbi:MAG TPA: hypothetical protein VFA56_14990 [Gaiellaceae bacterium]|nr:hypothetical protein [Gaiellaceae bacterium]
MADKAVLYSAVYDDSKKAVADMDAFEQLHDRELVGSYDAAVIENENGKANIVKRADRPRVNIIPETFGGGPLKKSELDEEAAKLQPGQSELIVVGEPTLGKAWEKSVRQAQRTAKQTFSATVDELADRLVGTPKS